MYVMLPSQYTAGMSRTETHQIQKVPEGIFEGEIVVFLVYAALSGKGAMMVAQHDNMVLQFVNSQFSCYFLQYSYFSEIQFLPVILCFCCILYLTVCNKSMAKQSN